MTFSSLLPQRKEGGKKGTKETKREEGKEGRGERRKKAATRARNAWLRRKAALHSYHPRETFRKELKS